MSWGKNYIVRPICWIAPILALIGGIMCFEECGSNIDNIIGLFASIGVAGGIVGILMNIFAPFTIVPITISKIEKHLFENYLIIIVEGKKVFQYERSIDSEYYDFQKFEDPYEFVLLRGVNTLFVELSSDEKLGLRNGSCLKGVQS